MTKAISLLRRGWKVAFRPSRHDERQGSLAAQWRLAKISTAVCPPSIIASRLRPSTSHPEIARKFPIINKQVLQDQFIDKEMQEVGRIELIPLVLGQ